MRWRHVLLSAILAATRPGAAWADEATTVDLAWEPSQPSETLGATITFSREIPATLHLPKDAEDPSVARLPWGEAGKLTLFADAGRRTLWVDRDLDDNLEEESSLPWPATGDDGVRSTRVRAAPASDAPWVEVRLSLAPGRDARQLRCVAWIHRLGSAVLGDRVRSIELVDDDGDLRFDRVGQDHAYVDLDGDGDVTLGAQSPERIAVGAEFRVGDVGYRLEVPAADGRHVRFVPLAVAPPAPSRRWVRLPVPPTAVVPLPPDEDFATLRAQASSNESWKWRPALTALGRLGTREAGALLVAVARKAGDEDRRATATRALGNVAFLPDRGQDLLRLAQKSPPPVAVAAIEALHAMGHPARSATLVPLVESASGDTLEAAALHLAYLGSETARDVLLAAWGRPRDPGDRRSVYAAIRALPSGPPADVAAEAATQLYGSSRATALLDLWTLGDARARAIVLDRAMVDATLDDDTRFARLQVLTACADEPCIAAVLATLPGADVAYRMRVAGRLATLRGAPVARALCAGLEHKAPDVRRMAAEVLAGLRHPGVLDALLKQARREDDPQVLGTVIESLGEHADPAAVALLTTFARRHPSPTRLAAVRALARAGGGNPKARELLIGFLDSSSWEERVVALDAIAADDGPREAALVLPNLRHVRRQVRRAAASAFGRLRIAVAVEPMIEQLAAEREASVRKALATALFRTTGMNLYDDASVWRRWWQDHHGEFVVPTAVPVAVPQAIEGTTEGFYGIPVRGSRLVFVVDQSSSMDYRSGAGTATDFQVAVDETTKAVARMVDGDYVDVIFFESEIHPWKGKLTELTSESRRTLSRHLKAQKPDGATNLYDALELALTYEDVEAVYVLSDGAPNCGRFTEESDILRAVRRLNQTAHATVHAVAVGYDSSLLRRLTEQNGGVYVKR